MVLGLFAVACASCLVRLGHAALCPTLFNLQPAAVGPIQSELR